MLFENVQNIYFAKSLKEKFLIQNNIKVNYSNCKGSKCGKCAYICPTNVFTLEGNEISVKSPEYCKLCCKCLEICPNGAITIKK
jgi:ferredoxin